VYPYLVVAEEVLEAAVCNNVFGNPIVRGAIIIVHGWEEISKVAVPGGPVHDQIVHNPIPLWIESSMWLQVGRPVPGVDGPMVLRLPNPIEENVLADHVTPAEPVIEVYPSSRSVVRNVASKGGVASQGLEESRDLLTPNTNVVDVVPLYDCALRVVRELTLDLRPIVAKTR